MNLHLQLIAPPDRNKNDSYNQLSQRSSSKVLSKGQVSAISAAKQKYIQLSLRNKYTTNPFQLPANQLQQLPEPQLINIESKQQQTPIHSSNNILRKFESHDSPVNHTANLSNQAIQNTSKIQSKGKNNLSHLFQSLNTEQLKLKGQTPQILKKLIGSHIGNHNYHQQTSYSKHKSIRINSRQTPENSQQSSSLWLGQVFQHCTSSAFKNYVSKQLDYAETKSYCCEQILTNLLIEIRKMNSVFQHRESTHNSSKNNLSQKSISREKVIYNCEPMKFINEEAKKILQYLCSKYPQTNIEGVNKKISELISTVNIDNWANDEYDLLRLSNIKFKFKQNSDYSEEIMSFLNYMIQIPFQKHRKYSDMTNYKFFEMVMSQIFSVILQKDEENDINHIIKANGELNLEKISKKDKESKQYREKVKRYTNYQIGCKIPSTLKQYSKEDISSGVIKIENNSISRVIDKWAEELSSKFKNLQENILHRPYRFKSAKNNTEYLKMSKQNKQSLYQILCKNKKELENYIYSLNESVYDLSGKLARVDQSELSLLQFIKPEQKFLAQFCVKMSESSSQYFIQLVQKKIHLLLKSVEELKQQWASKYTVKQSTVYDSLDISLITFKIGDIFRCKITSYQKQIVRIINIFINLSNNWQNNLIKIIRIKNRLESGTRDVLINFMFDGICPCEIQLAVADKFSEKQHYFDKFNHFLYELKRAYLGPIMEMCKIWSQEESKSQHFRKNLNKVKQKKLKEKRICQQLQQFSIAKHDYFVPYKFPFICDSCNLFNPRNDLIYFSGVINNKIFCGNCWKIKIAIEKQGQMTAIKKWYVFKRFLTQHSNFYRMLPIIKQLSSEKQIFSQKYQILIPINSKIIQVQFYTIIKLDRNNMSSLHQFQEFAYINSTFNSNGEYLKDVCTSKFSNFNNKKGKRDNFQKMKQNYIFFGFETLIQLVDLPKSYQICSMQLISSIIPNIRKFEEKNPHAQIKIARVRTSENFYYFLPFFVVDEVDLSLQVIREKNIEQITSSIKKKQEVLELEGKRLTTQWADIGQKMRLRLAYTIKELYLSQNRLKTIDFIDQLHVLRVLQANNNQIQEIPQIPPNLQELSLLQNRIKAIHRFTKSSNQQICYNLKRLKLSYNPIEKIENISQLSKLSFLLMSKCCLTKIEGLPRSLTFLALGFNQISKIQNLEELKNLQILNLVQNRIYKIENLESLQNLEVLILTKNKISVIENLSTLKKLSTLYIGNTRLGTQQASDEIVHYEGLKQIKALKKLKLYNNKIKCLFEIIGVTDSMMKTTNFFQMKEINLSQNQIKYIKNIEVVMPFLNIINVSNNKISKIDNIINLVMLVELDVSHNEVEAIPETGWKNLYKLRILNFSFNKISSVPNLSDLSLVKAIDFRNNRVKCVYALPKDLVGQHELCRQINLENNLLFEEGTENQLFQHTYNCLSKVSSITKIRAKNNGKRSEKLESIIEMISTRSMTNIQVDNDIDLNME